jgi:hypothetical protein
VRQLTYRKLEKCVSTTNMNNNDEDLLAKNFSDMKFMTPTTTVNNKTNL